MTSSRQSQSWHRPNLSMPPHEQLTLALTALRQHADEQGRFHAPPSAKGAILAAIQPYGGKEGNADTLRTRLVRFGLLTHAQDGYSGNGFRYVVDLELPEISAEKFKELQRAYRARKRSAAAGEPVETEADEVDQLIAHSEGLEEALAQVTAEADALRKERDALQRRVAQLTDQVKTFERADAARKQRAAKALARYRK